MSPEVKWSLIATITAAIIGGIFILIAKRIPEKQPEVGPEQSHAEILRPKTGQVVGHSFVVEGAHENLPPKYHMWLATEMNGLLWPKEPEVRAADRRWSIKIVESGSPPGGFFTLVLFQVSAEGNKTIMKWIARGHRTGDWPGIDPNKMHDYSQLYVVRDLRLW